jgi:type II secretory pathway component PulM
MKLKITPRDKKFLTVGGLVLGIYLLAVWVVQPIHAEQKHMDQQIQNKTQFIQKYYEILSQDSYYNAKKIANARTRLSLAKKFFKETQPGLAAARLQKIIKDFALQSRVKIEQVRVEKSKAIDQIPTVPISMTLRSSLRNLSEFIYRMENSEKFLVVEEISTQRINKSNPEELKTRLLVSGFVQDLTPRPNGPKA